jgi:hypothetical protein
MIQRLGELLLHKNLLTQAQLEEALQAQVIFGGKLGTILIEMGLISEKVLGEALRQMLGFPCAQAEDMERIPRTVIDIVSAELADKHKVLPLSVSGRKMTLAMANPKDIQAIDEISFRTGHIVLPVMALEVRLYLALEQYYGIKRPMRYIAPPKNVREELDQLNIIRDSDRGKPAAPVAEEEGYLGVPGSEHIHVPAKKPMAEPVPVAAPAPAPVPIPIEDPGEEFEELEELDDFEVTLADTTKRLVTATNRDDVADALIEYLGNHYARAVLFMVVAGQVTGWRAAKNRQPIPAIEQFQLPLSEASVLKTAVESNSFFLGPVPPSGANLALTTLLGKPAPTTAVLLPLSMLGRVVGLIYVDDPEVNMAESVAALQQVTAKVLLTFELLILQNKILRT